MKMFLHLAVLMAFAMPVLAHAAGSAVSQPNSVVAQGENGGGAATPKKKGKKGKKGKKKKGAAAAAEGAGEGK